MTSSRSSPTPRCSATSTTRGAEARCAGPAAPRCPDRPVYRASDEILQRLFTLGEGEIPLMVGSLLHREGISVPVSGKELHRHTAILAMTRYGKSYFAGRIMEQLLRQGASILVIDAHGDYANMTQDPERRRARVLPRQGHRLPPRGRRGIRRPTRQAPTHQRQPMHHRRTMQARPRHRQPAEDNPRKSGQGGEGEEEVLRPPGHHRRPLRAARGGRGRGGDGGEEEKEEGEAGRDTRRPHH